ncbi:MAG: GNAT family N-acetyltransferase [Parcubacteria group bacterium]|jgi:ribosomal protein S18 acetylase RimI-like enzyme
MFQAKRNKNLKNSIVIRPMRALEAAKVSRLAREIISALEFYTPAARSCEINKYSAKVLLRKIKEDKFSVLVAREGNEIVGFCINQDEGTVVWLEWFAVTGLARGKGVGRLLIRALDDSAKKRGAHKIWCDTRVNNFASIKLLKSEKYKKIANLKNFWHHQDYFLFEKEVH